MLLEVGALVLVYGAMVGILKHTHLLKGFNEARVEKKRRLAQMVYVNMSLIVKEK